jgi:tetratricopeptide (TPR) repeat protein
LAIALSIASAGCQSGNRTVTPGWEDATGRFRPVVEIELAAPKVRSDYRWPREIASLTLALVELGLAELPGVVPRVSELPVAPGLEHSLHSGARKWRASIELSEEIDGSVRFSLRMCPEPGLCKGEQAFASYDRPSLAIAELIEWAGELVGRPAPAGAFERWRRPQTEDSYAALIAGRAAGVFYGIYPDVAPQFRGHRDRDPLTRATYIDPKMSIAQWMRGRMALREGDLRTALSAFDRGLDEHPESLALELALAATFAAGSEWAEARNVWDRIEDIVPDDVRFVAARIRAELGSDAAEPAARTLAELPAIYDHEIEVTELRVVAADRLGPGPDYEQLLADWQQAATLNPEPVRRRIGIRLKAGDLEGAFALLEDLERRGAAGEAGKLSVALGNELGNYAKAARAAESIGLGDLARRLRARRALEKDPAAVPSGLEDPRTVEEKLVVASIVLEEDPRRALQLGDSVLRRERYHPEALAVAMTANAALGRDREAERLRKRLYSADPSLAAELASVAWGISEASAAGPSTAAGSTGSGSQVH